MTTLQATASVMRAPLFKTQDGDSPFEFLVASIKDFPEAGYLPTPERRIQLTSDTERAQRYLLEAHDVLVITVGSIGHVTVVPEDCEANIIPATNMYVVRFSDDRDRRSKALYSIFKSPAGQELLENLARGRGIQIVPKKVFARIQIPEFSEELLQTTEELWRRENELYRESLSKLNQSRTVFDSLKVSMPEPVAG